MPDFTYGPSPVLVETTGEFAIGATGVLRATTGGAPVQLYDLNGSPLPSVLVGPKGAHQAFRADIPNGVLDFGSVLLPVASLEQQQAALEAQTIAQQAAINAQAAADATLIAQDAASAAEASATQAAAQAQALPDAVQDIVATQVTAGTGLNKVAGAGNDTVTLSTKYGSTAGTAVQGNDPRVTDGQPNTTAAIRQLANVDGGAAPWIHTHTAAQISDVQAFMRTFLTATVADDARSALGVGTRAREEAIVFWEENGAGTKWGTIRPSGYKRVRFASNGSTGTEDPMLTIGNAAVDIWEDPEPA